jgi:hypothetical protein
MVSRAGQDVHLQNYLLSALNSEVMVSVGLASVENGCCILDVLLPKNKREVILLIVPVYLFPLCCYYPRKHRPCEALNAVLVLHPLASASCCRVIEATVTATTPNNASADTMAITANVVLLSISKSWLDNYY